MKTSTKIIAVAALIGSTFMATAGEVVIKPSRYSPPTKSQFHAPLGAPVAQPKCARCKDELVATTTQDTKLKTKTVLVAKHGCGECKTTIVHTGAQKATGKDVLSHTCGAMLAVADNCCGGTK